MLSVRLTACRSLADHQRALSQLTREGTRVTWWNGHITEKNKFPLVGLLNKLPKYPSLFETVLITINDYLVYKFLNKRINFHELTNLINRISNLKEFQKFKKIKPRNIKQIYNLRDYVHLKLNTLGI